MKTLICALNRQWLQKPMVLPAAVIIGLMVAAFGYGQVAALGIENSERLDRFQDRTIKALDEINEKLYKLVQTKVAQGR